MRVRTIVGVISAVVLLSGCMTELAQPWEAPTAVVVDQQAPAEGLPALFAPTAAPAAPAAPAVAPVSPGAAPAAPAGASFTAIDCANPAPADVEVCNGN